MIDARQRQRLDDLEAQAYLDKSQGPGLVHRVFTNTPVHSEDLTADNSTIPLGYLTPIDLGGKNLVLHSYRAFVAAYTAASNPTWRPYTIAVYEAQPFKLADEIDAMSIQLRLVQGTAVKSSVASTASALTTYKVVHVLPQQKLLRADKQYYLWTDSEFASFSGPSLTTTPFRSGSDTLGGTTLPPDTQRVRFDSYDAVAAPLVELRSKYGAMLYGSPGE